MSNSPTVFVSHSHKDNAFGLRLIADLRAKLGENNVWYDVSGGLHGGDEWRREIVRQITARDVFLVILSPNALASTYVQWEMDMAYHLYLTRKKRLLPIHYQPCDLPVDWDILHWLACRDPQADAKGYTYNVEAILADLQRQPARGPQTPTPPVQPSPTPVRVAPDAPPPLRPQPAIAPNHFPQRLASLGFVGQVINGVEVITPPLCDVPAGSFMMGSNKRHDKHAGDDELPQTDIFVAAFQIARYPVTVAEYACAVRVGAVRVPKDIWDVFPLFGQSFSDILRSNHTPQRTRKTQFEQLDRLDHPVVGISWSDANAYVRWLAERTKQPWRLPTEAEWEKAARGTDGRIYPWGNQWGKTRTETWGDTAPVGNYPSGVSPYGTQDMVGNVQEWTSSVYKPYPYNQATCESADDRTGARVARGGFWRSNPSGVHAATRYRLDPLGTLVVGFRVVRGVGAGTG